MQEYGLYANILVYLHICLKGIRCTEHTRKWSCAYLSPLSLCQDVYGFFLPTPYGPSFFPHLVNSSSLLPVYLPPAMSVYEEARFPLKSNKVVNFSSVVAKSV